MTPELHSLILIPAGSLRVESPPRTELVLDYYWLAVALAGVVAMVVIVVGRRRNAHR